jgi:Xaa-Pro aminopeptidase
VRARQYRLARIREQLLAFDCAAILLYDPVNIRYALDASNMQVWTSREATRYALIFADGGCGSRMIFTAALATFQARCQIRFLSCRRAVYFCELQLQ